MFRTIVCFILIFPFVLGCFPQKKPVKKPHLPTLFQCLNSQSQCHLNTQFGEFDILFDRAKVIAEVPFQIQLRYQGRASLQNINAYMEGKNMFMGKIPVIFNSSLVKQKTSIKTQIKPQNIKSTNMAQTFIAKVMVVACTEPKMQWRLWFSVDLKRTNSDGEKTKKPIKQGFFVDFNSSYE